MLYPIVRPLLFALPAETAHGLAMAAMRTVARSSSVTRLLRSRLDAGDPALAVDALGLKFPHPVGLAAGLDKDAEAIEAFGALGFGFVEVGTVTAEAQAGNAPPRLFRLPRDRALINRMGFNNAGAEAAARRIGSVRNRRTIVGINIGKTRRVSAECALDDYARSAMLVAPHADYVTINVSSPNTPGLRDLQNPASLHPLLQHVRSALDAAQPARHVPLVLKIAPDLADEEIDAIGALALELKLDGIIATNTTTARRALLSDPRKIAACGEGGLSGAPLKARALTVLRRLRTQVGARVTLIASGGVETADDAWARICAGATLIQLYTGLVYEGPLLARRITLGLSRRLEVEGMQNIMQAVGQG